MELHRPCIFIEFNYHFPIQLMTWVAPLDPTACGRRTKGNECFSLLWLKVTVTSLWPQRQRTLSLSVPLTHCRRILYYSTTTINKIPFSIMLNKIQPFHKQNLTKLNKHNIKTTTITTKNTKKNQTKKTPQIIKLSPASHNQTKLKPTCFQFCYI